jgi:hypothetical protein
VGDHVFLKVKANRSSLKLRNCSKLVARYCGPFEILERIGPVAYMIQLPAFMVVRTLLGRMRIQCGQNTRIVFRIFENFDICVHDAPRTMHK